MESHGSSTNSSANLVFFFSFDWFPLEKNNHTFVCHVDGNLCSSRPMNRATSHPDADKHLVLHFFSTFRNMYMERVDLSVQLLSSYLEAMWRKNLPIHVNHMK